MDAGTLSNARRGAAEAGQATLVEDGRDVALLDASSVNLLVSAAGASVTYERGVVDVPGNTLEKAAGGERAGLVGLGNVERLGLAANGEEGKSGEESCLHCDFLLRRDEEAAGSRVGHYIPSLAQRNTVESATGS